MYVCTHICSCVCEELFLVYMKIQTVYSEENLSPRIPAANRKINPICYKQSMQSNKSTSA